MPKVFIYGLFASNAPDLLVYVGKADDPALRFKQHKRIASGRTPKHNRKFYCWLRDTEASFKILEELSDATHWEDREKFWIAYWRERNPHLFNICAGGNGGSDECGRPASGHTGMKFSKLTLVKIVQPKATAGRNGSAFWGCECECGRCCIVVRYDRLQCGQAVQCPLCKPPKKIAKPKNGWTKEARLAAAERARKRNLAIPVEERKRQAQKRNAIKSTMYFPCTQPRNAISGKFTERIPHA